MAFVRQHARGERILCASSDLRSVATLVRSTRECWDGTGYPDGLAGERLYRPQIMEEEALAELERSAGTQFDPAVVAALVDTVRASVASQRSG